MFFTDALDLHTSCSPEGCHRDILGDGFLMESNPIYRKVKRFALEIGCVYVEAYPEYLLLPFHELPKIVASKRIPYVPSARLMRTVELEHPGVYATEDLPMPESYHLHESAHVVAEHVLAWIKAADREEEILKAILAESFANTVDALMGMAVQDETQYFFVKQNCYMHPQKKMADAMNVLVDSMGFRFVFMLTFFTYVHANFLTKPIAKKAIRDLASRYATPVRITPKAERAIETIRAIGEKLDPNFRLTTTANYFKQRGFAGELEDLLNFPFQKLIADQPEFRTAIEALCATLA